MKRRKILITAALPYANGLLHFGHIAGAYLPADCYARFEKLRQNDVLFVCGSDEYGVAITLNAELKGKTPKEHVDHYHPLIQNLFKQIKIEFDHYSRTTCDEHVPLVQSFFLSLLDNKHIEVRDTDQLYSEQDGRFLADRYVIGTCPRCHFEEARGDECQKCGASYEATDLIKPRSKLTGAPLVLQKTTHWFLRFDHFREKLDAFLNSRPWKPNVIHFAKAYLDDLRPRAITRDLNWGVPVPLGEAKGKVFYVWFDAPIGYISATKEWAAQKKKEIDAWEDYWLDPKTHYVQFMGKDNISFHALFFPAMIMGQNQPYKLVDDLVANEFYNLEGKRFSKSDGWTIDLDSFFEKFHADQIRYTIAANAPETADSEFSWKDFQMRCNGELLGKLGNLVNRVLVFAQNHCGCTVPQNLQMEDTDLRFLNTLTRLSLDIEEQYETYRLRKVSQLIMEMAQAGNAYFDLKAPWKDAKFEHTRLSMETTIACCLECLKRLAILAYPLIPDTAQKIWSMLGYTTLIQNNIWEKALNTPVPTSQKLPKPYVLFQKIEDSVIETEIQKLHGLHEKAIEKQEPPFLPLKEQITIDDFGKVDLRIGIILSAEKVAKSKKLLKLEVDIGLEKRTILSGISQNYSSEQLIGKKVVVVANLKPATLMGIESQGMILAGSFDHSLEILEIDNLPAGAIVT